MSTDFIKSDSRRDEFVRSAPELVVVDEAHTCAADPTGTGRRHQRHQLLRDLAASGTGSQDRHLILATATLHSGNTGAFRSLIGLLNPAFADLPEEDRIDERTRRNLARHFVQRRRYNIRKDFTEEESTFPKRSELPERDGEYRLTADYTALLRDAIAWAQETVRDESGGHHRQRVRYWSALGLLRCLASSPAAAAATLRARAASASAATVEEADTAGRRIVLDQDDTEDEGRVDTAPGAFAEDTDETDSPQTPDRSTRRRLLAMAEHADALAGPGTDAKLAHATALIRRLLDDGFNPIVFCRFLDTADYLAENLTRVLGDKVLVEAVTGRLAHDERERRIEAMGGRAPRLLVATDCLSEGINLQELFDAVVHYDLPWNPTRLEQREGRVDRFGQPSPEVRVATVYGVDNRIDEAVRNVLLRKHRQIRDETGVSIPVPGSNDEFIETVFDNLFAEEQLTLDLAGSRSARLTTEALFQQWDDAAAREHKARTRYAQYAIKVDEVTAQVDAARAAVGSNIDVGRFVRAACVLAGGSVTDTDSSTLVDLSEAPASLRDALAAAGQPLTLTVGFTLPVSARVTYLERTHPFVETLATYVLDGSLDSHPTGARVAARCGAIRTNEVSQLTTLLLVRYRFDITVRRRGDDEHRQLAEDTGVHAFSGLPDAPAWLDEAATERLLAATPNGNIAPEQREEFLRRIVGDRDRLAEHLHRFADEHAAALEEQHNRVRSDAGVSGKAAVTAHTPVDVLGAYVLLPS